MARFFIKNGNYFETISDVYPDTDPGADGQPAGFLGVWGGGRIEVPQRPSPDHVWQGGAWSYVAPDPRAAAEASRAAAVLNKGIICEALMDAGILPAAEAVEASRGGWPASFTTFVAGLPERDVASAQIKWATASEVNYGDTLMQALALYVARGSQSGAYALLDNLFGIGGQPEVA